MASPRGNSTWDEQEDNHEAAARRLRQLECVNRYCNDGDDLCVATEFVCSYYNVSWKSRKKVCKGCVARCLTHYKNLSIKFVKQQCVMDGNFPNYDSHGVIESSSSSEDDEPMPSTSKYGLPPDKNLTDSLIVKINDFLRKNNDLIDKQINLCDNYLEKQFKESMREADLIDDMTIQIEKDIELMRSVIYDPYKPCINVLPSDSDSTSEP